ncbi:ATP-binding protein [Bacillus sp. DJP31]|uniref:sensor histidine kinase n=1 Tax=Bacillus sp. DJP31 TaxID=3409789 RepID=UPI003BB79A4B
MFKMLHRVSFRSKILTILLLLTFLLSGFSLIFVQSIEEIKNVSNIIETDNIPEYLWLSHWEEEINLKEYIVKSSLSKANCCEFMEEFNSFIEEDQSHLEEKNGPMPLSLKKFKTDITLLDLLIINNVQGFLSFKDQEGAKSYIAEEYIPRLSLIKKELMIAKKETISSLQGHSNRFTVIIENSLWTLLFLTMGAISLSIYVSFRISASLSKPIDSMIQKVDQIAQGDYGLTIKETSQFELQQLTHSINQMSVRLKESFEMILSDKIYREQILNSLPVGIITIDNRNADVSINTSAQQLLNVDGKDLKELEKEFILLENKPFWDILSSKQICQNVKVPFLKNEETKQLLLSQSELVDQYQEVIGRIIFFIDITETEELEHRIHQSEKLALVGEMAAGAAHEIRNPLAVIHGFISLMNASFTEVERGQYHLALLMKEIERINFIIEEMLLQSKPGAPILRSSYVEDIIEEILPLITQSLGFEQVEFSIELERLPLLVDSKQLKQVFHNLIRNSIEAMEGEGKISIFSKSTKLSYEIHIRDSGPGIPFHIQSSVFDPFISLKEKGTGLGLTIVQRIVENHGGNIELVSSSQQGTSFIITLPISEQMKKRAI